MNTNQKAELNEVVYKCKMAIIRIVTEAVILDQANILTLAQNELRAVQTMTGDTLGEILEFLLLELTTESNLNMSDEEVIRNPNYSLGHNATVQTCTKYASDAKQFNEKKEPEMSIEFAMKDPEIKTVAVSLSIAVLAQLELGGRLTLNQLCIKNTHLLIQVEKRAAIRREDFMGHVIKTLVEENRVEKVPGREDLGEQWQLVLRPSLNLNDVEKVAVKRNTLEAPITTAVAIKRLKQDILHLFQDPHETTLSFKAIQVANCVTFEDLAKATDRQPEMLAEQIITEMLMANQLQVAPDYTPENRRYCRGGVDFKQDYKPFDFTPHPTMPEKEIKVTTTATVVDPKEFQQALEIIALQFVNAEIKEIEDGQHPTIIEGAERHNWYKAVRGLILDHAFEFRLSKPKDSNFGIPGGISQVQIVKTIYPMEAWQVKAAFDLLYNEGY